MATVDFTAQSARRRRMPNVVLLVAAPAVAVGVLEVWGGALGAQRASVWLGAAQAILLAASLGLPVYAAVTVTRRQLVIGRRWKARLRTHVVVGAAAACGAAAAEAGAHALTGEPSVALVPALLGEGLVWYALWAAITHAVVLARRIPRARAVRLHVLRALERAGREQAAAQLRAVKTELHPVLIANTLVSAQSLVQSDPAAAERLVVELGLLMREAVAGAGTDAVTLGEEVDAARERSTEGPAGAHAPEPLGAGAVRYALDDEVRDVLVPHLVVPALLACAAEAEGVGGRVEVRGRAVARADGDWIELSVLTAAAARDSAPGSGPTAAPHATAALERLLRHFYGAGESAWQFSVTQGADGRSSVRLLLPIWTDDRGPTPVVPGAADPGERVFETWVLAATDDAARRGASDVWAVFGLWALLVALSYPPAWTSREQLFFKGVFAATLAPVCGAAVVAARRWPVGAGGRSDARADRRLLAHLLVGGGVAALAAGLRVAARSAARGAGITALQPFTAGEVVSRGGALFVLYALFVTIARLVAVGREHRRTAQIVAEARAAYTSRADRRRRSELRALKAEMNPHFVGNALHTAAALVRSAPDAAGRLLAALGALAREAGARVDVQEVSLSDEIAGLDPFLALEHARLGTAGGTLSVAWDIAPDVVDAAVPHLVLQPLVENAVRHGLAPRGGGGRLAIRARRAGPRLELAVTDDGVGIRPDQFAGRGAAAPGDDGAPTGASTARPGTGGVGSGAGLRGLRQRLALLYGAAATCALEPDPGGGTVARVTLPYRRIPPPGGNTVSLLAAAGG